MKTKKMLSENVIEDLQDFAASPQGFVLMVGAPGRGKSYAAMSIYEKIATFKLPHRDWDEAWFINQTDLYMMFLDYHQKYKNPMSLLKQVYICRFFVLDDLGVKTPSPAFSDFLYAILDKRWNERKVLSTIITTNLTSAEMRKDLGERIFSRIASGRNYVVIGDDRRFTELGF